MVSAPDLVRVAAPGPPAETARHRAGTPRRRQRAMGRAAMWWLSPALLLIGGVVIYPAIELFDYYHGILNRLLLALHLVGRPVDWLGDDRFTMLSIVTVGVFVTVPFTTHVLLAGLNAIPEEVYEAARIDGAGWWQTYRHVTLPLLRPALLVAAVLNIIYVFNSFPVVYTLNDRNPGFSHDTSITFMYKLAFKSADHDVGMAAAAGVMNVALILVAVVIYLRLVDWRKDHS